MSSYKSMEDVDKPSFRGEMFKDQSTWLAEQFPQARQWGWGTPEQLHFLIINTLNETDPLRLRSWLPHAGEAPQVHFERLLNKVKFWSGEQSS
jgi:hypothetical protein